MGEAFESRIHHARRGHGNDADGRLMRGHSGLHRIVNGHAVDVLPAFSRSDAGHDLAAVSERLGDHFTGLASGDALHENSVFG